MVPTPPLAHTLRGGNVPSDNESAESEDIIPKHFNDMDEILGKRESINPRHVLESFHVPNSESPEMSELEGDILEKNPRNKKPLASTPVPKRRDADVEKKLPRKRAADAAERPSKKGTKKKGKAESSGVDEPTLISFLECSQERDEAFMERMDEAETEYRKDQQKFSMDALAMLGNILKDVSKGNE